MKPAKIFNYALTLIVVITLIQIGFFVNRWLEEAKVLREIVARLSADSRAAEILVTKSEYSEETAKIMTTIKFLEYDSSGEPLEPKYFSFQGNIIQFQSLVIRFKDDYVKAGDKLKGKSAYLFLKAFVLDGDKTQSFDITPVNTVPEGYQVLENESEYEKELWSSFWDYALDPEKQAKAGIKNAQIEAPGSMFVPGTIYTLRIEHDGGLRIDSAPIPQILKGEEI